MANHCDRRSIERVGAILRVADRYSGDELDAALNAARRAIEFSLKEISAAANAGGAMFATIDAARLILSNRA